MEKKKIAKVKISKKATDACNKLTLELWREYISTW